MTTYLEVKEAIEQAGYPDGMDDFDSIYNLISYFYVQAEKDMIECAKSIVDNNSSEASKDHASSTEYFNAKDRLDERFDFMAGATWVIEELGKRV